MYAACAADLLQQDKVVYMPQNTSIPREYEAQSTQATDTLSKQPYDSPMLTIYGRLTELTEGGNPAKMNDAGGPSAGKL